VTDHIPGESQSSTAMLHGCRPGAILAAAADTSLPDWTCAIIFSSYPTPRLSSFTIISTRRRRLVNDALVGLRFHLYSARQLAANSSLQLDRDESTVSSKHCRPVLSFAALTYIQRTGRSLNPLSMTNCWVCSTGSPCSWSVTYHCHRYIGLACLRTTIHVDIHGSTALVLRHLFCTVCSG
jgi:hypothetical protein